MAGSPTSIVVLKTYKKSGDGAMRAYMHNTRIEEPANADPALLYMNEVILDQTNGKSVDDYIEDELYDLRMSGAMTGTVRSNAVGTIEVIMNADNVYLQDGLPKQDFDIDGWRDASMKWADEHFNPPDHEISFVNKEGEEETRKVQNIYSAVLHRDESSPHIHLLVMPIDDKGHLNSRYFRTSDRFQGRDSYISSYYEAVKSYGLERGQEGSPAKVKNIRSYHENIEKAMAAEAPMPVPGERIEDYRERVTDEIRNCRSHMNDQDRRHELELNQEKGKRQVLLRETREFHREINKTLGLGSGTEIDMERVREISGLAQKQEEFEKAVKSYPDRNEAQDLQDRVNQILLWQREREEALKKDRSSRIL